MRWNNLNFLDRIKRLYYKWCGKVIATMRFERRTRAHKRNSKERYSLEVAFRELEVSLRDVHYPNNDFNKMMSMALSDLELFELIVRRFRRERMLLTCISREDQFLHSLDPTRRSYPTHPLEKVNNSSIKVDVQSLFIFGTILVNRLSLLLKMYLPDRSSSAKIDMYSKIGILYSELNKSQTLSKAALEFRSRFILKIKWLYSVLRFYRNEFIEHLDRGYQQGMNFGTYSSDFTLSSYKWDYGDDDNEKVEELRLKLEKLDVKVHGRSDGGRSLINRYYIQRLFDNIVLVPDSMLKETLDVIEEVGVHSPQPEKVIKEVEEYVEGVLRFMKEHLDISELNKYRKS